MDSDVLQWCFDYFFHMDEANAQVHCAPVKFSPITFRLMQAIMDKADENGQDVTQEVMLVKRHQGLYAEDVGR